MSEILDKIQALENQVEELEKQYLRLAGWEYTCQFCFWLWQKTFPPDEVLKRKETTFLCSQDTAMSIQKLDDSLRSDYDG